MKRARKAEAVPSNVVPIRPGLKWALKQRDVISRLSPGAVQLAEQWDSLSGRDRAEVAVSIAHMLRRQRELQA